MKKENSKHRIFALLKLLINQSDLNHPLSMPAIISYLEAQGYPCERKAIYDDFKCLSKAGIDVLVAGSAVFGKDSYKDAIFSIRNAAEAVL